MDTLSPVERSERMSRVKGRDTGPERAVRRLVTALGYRYRLGVGALPGRPDLVFRSRRKVIFVHGCFWHRHGECPLTRLPKTRLEFWIPKLEANKQRDERNLARLHADGWSALVIWECELAKVEEVRERLDMFLKEPM
jgi:DNA mismatch endonuclease (patch repair protein)